MIALQMSYPQMNIQKLYIRPQRLYFNVKFDWQQMNSLLNLIKGEKLQQAIRILLE
jgi:endonuclease/exonuclease/phosphatase (EEP) superfamily protein YafD